jgi:hypothetical protein
LGNLRKCIQLVRKIVGHAKGVFPGGWKKDGVRKREEIAPEMIAGRLQTRRIEFWQDGMRK